MSIVRVVFRAAKLVTSLASIGFGLYGLGIDNPIMACMSDCGQWWFTALVVCGSLNIAAMLWWGLLKKGEGCCESKCQPK